MFSKQDIVFHLRPSRPTVLTLHTESSRPLLAHLAWNASLLEEKLGTRFSTPLSHSIFIGAAVQLQRPEV